MNSFWGWKIVIITEFNCWLYSTFKIVFTWKICYVFAKLILLKDLINFSSGFDWNDFRSRHTIFSGDGQEGDDHLAGLNFINILRARFSSKILVPKISNPKYSFCMKFWHQKRALQKICSFNIDEIENRKVLISSTFEKQLFVKKCFVQLFSNFS